MNLGDFHTEVAAHLKRGTAMDPTIPGLVRRAALFLERNYSFLYMSKFWEFDVVENDRHIVLPNSRIKAIEFLRWVPDWEDLPSGDFSYVKQVNPRDQTAWSSGIPVGYWRDGDLNIIFDSYASETLHGEIKMQEISAWSAEAGFQHWLMTNAEDLLMAQTLLNAALFQKEAAMVASYKAIRDEALSVAINSDIEERGANTNSSMLYVPDWGQSP